MTKIPPQNPFQNSDDWLSELVKLDKKVISTSKNQFQKLYQKKILETSPWSLNSLIYRFSQHLVMASMITFVVGSLLTGVMAQAFAPNDFKPTKVYQNFVQKFQSNKQVERDPFTALKPDAQNNVFNYDTCGLSVKYPKKIGVHNIDPLRDMSDTFYRPSLLDNVILTDVQDYLDSIKDYSSDVGQTKTDVGAQATIKKANAEKNPYQNLTISCYTLGSRAVQYDVPQQGDNLTKEELREKVGWFIHEGNLKNIRSNSIVLGRIELTFEYNDKAYNVSFTDPDYTIRGNDITEQAYLKNGITKFQGIFGNQIQLQFNELVTSQADSTIKEDARIIKNKSISQLPKNPYNLPQDKLPPDQNKLRDYEQPGVQTITSANLISASCGTLVRDNVQYILTDSPLTCFLQFDKSMPISQINSIKVGLSRNSNSNGAEKIVDCTFVRDNVNARGDYGGTIYNTVNCDTSKMKLDSGQYELLISVDGGNTFQSSFSKLDVTSPVDPSNTPNILFVEKNQFSKDKKSYTGLKSVDCPTTSKPNVDITCRIHFDRSPTQQERETVSLILRRDTVVLNKPIMLSFTCTQDYGKSETDFTCTITPEADTFGTLSVDFVAFGQSIDSVSQVNIDK